MTTMWNMPAAGESSAGQYVGPNNTMTDNPIWASATPVGASSPSSGGTNWGDIAKLAMPIVQLAGANNGASNAASTSAASTGNYQNQINSMFQPITVPQISGGASSFGGGGAGAGGASGAASIDSAPWLSGVQYTPVTHVAGSRPEFGYNKDNKTWTSVTPAAQPAQPQYTNQQIIDAYNATVGKGAMSEADFVSQAMGKYNVSANQLTSARNDILSQNAASVAPPAPVDQVITPYAPQAPQQQPVEQQQSTAQPVAANPLTGVARPNFDTYLKQGKSYDDFARDYGAWSAANPNQPDYMGRVFSNESIQGAKDWANGKSLSQILEKAASMGLTPDQVGQVLGASGRDVLTYTGYGQGASGFNSDGSLAYQWGWNDSPSEVSNGERFANAYLVNGSGTKDNPFGAIGLDSFVFTKDGGITTNQSGVKVNGTPITSSGANAAQTELAAPAALSGAGDRFTAAQYAAARAWASGKTFAEIAQKAAEMGLKPDEIGKMFGEFGGSGQQVTDVTGYGSGTSGFNPDGSPRYNVGFASGLLADGSKASDWTFDTERGWIKKVPAAVSTPSGYTSGAPTTAGSGGNFVATLDAPAKGRTGDFYNEQVPIAGFNTRGVDDRAAQTYARLVGGIDRANAIAASQGFAQALRNGTANSTAAATMSDDITRKFSAEYAKLAEDATKGAIAENQSNYASYLSGKKEEIGQNFNVGQINNAMNATIMNNDTSRMNNAMNADVALKNAWLQSQTNMNTANISAGASTSNAATQAAASLQAAAWNNETSRANAALQAQAQIAAADRVSLANAQQARGSSGNDLMAALLPLLTGKGSSSSASTDPDAWKNSAVQAILKQIPAGGTPTTQQVLDIINARTDLSPSVKSSMLDIFKNNSNGPQYSDIPIDMNELMPDLVYYNDDPEVYGW